MRKLISTGSPFETAYGYSRAAVDGDYVFVAGNAVTGVPNTRADGTLIPSLGREGVLSAFYGNPRQVFVTGTVKF